MKVENVDRGSKSFFMGVLASSKLKTGQVRLKAKHDKDLKINKLMQKKLQNIMNTNILLPSKHDDGKTLDIESLGFANGA